MNTYEDIYKVCHGSETILRFFGAAISIQNHNIVINQISPEWNGTRTNLKL